MRETQSARQCDEHWRAPASDRRLFTLGPCRLRLLGDDFLDRAIGQSDIGGRGVLGPRVRIGAANGAHGAMHIHRAVEVRAFHDTDARRGDIATYRGTRRDEHRNNAVQVSLNCAFDDDAPSMSIADDHAVDPDGDALGMMDRAFDATLQNYVFVSGELALENEGFAENGDLPRGIR